MRKKNYIIGGLIFLLSFSFAQDCYKCHIESFVSNKTKVNSSILVKKGLTAASLEICYSCHNGPILDDRLTFYNIIHGQGHPVKGKVSCGDCHNPHTKEGSSKKYAFMAQKNVCQKCHQDKYKSQIGKFFNHPIGEYEIKFNKKTYKIKAECLGCHKVHTPKQKPCLKFKIGQSSSTCFECHIRIKNDTNSHPDVGCLTCHKMHKALNKKLLPVKELSLACSNCHKEEKQVLKTPHKGCENCHTPHFAKGDFLLRLNTNIYIPKINLHYSKHAKSCLACHNGKKAKDVGVFNRKTYTHPMDCTICHNPHLNKKYMLYNKAPDICLYCHKPILWTSHKNLKNKYKCLKCHIIHNSPYKNLTYPKYHLKKYQLKK